MIFKPGAYRPQAGMLGFLKLHLYVCLCVCLPPRILITIGMIWTPYDWLKKSYSFYMAAVVVIGGEHQWHSQATMIARAI